MARACAIRAHHLAARDNLFALRERGSIPQLMEMRTLPPRENHSDIKEIDPAIVPFLFIIDGARDGLARSGNFREFIRRTGRQ